MRRGTWAVAEGRVLGEGVAFGQALRGRGAWCVVGGLGLGGHLFKNVLEGTALATDRVDSDLAVQEQAGETGVEGRRVFDADVQYAVSIIKIKSKQNAGVKEISREFFRSIALNRQFF